jgi:uncharacterized protein YlxP (DUF503 family)
VVLAARFELRLPGCRSLKDKRSRLRPVIDRVRHRHHTSVAETDRQDQVERAVIEVAVVAPGPARAEEIMDGLERLVWSADGIEVVEMTRRWLEYD